MHRSTKLLPRLFRATGQHNHLNTWQDTNATFVVSESTTLDLRAQLARG
jgi:hypothetical protein